MRVTLLTDRPILGRGFAAILQGVPDLELESIRPVALDKIEADVLVIDLPPMTRLDILHELRHIEAQYHVPKIPIVLWTQVISTEMALQSIALGVLGIIPQTLPAETMLECLRTVAAHDSWFEREMTSSFLFTKRVQLTKREGEVVTLISKGLKNKEIGDCMGITEGTVKVYLGRIFQKVGVKDRHALRVYGLKNLSTLEQEPELLTAKEVSELRALFVAGQHEAEPANRCLVLDGPPRRLSGSA